MMLTESEATQERNPLIHDLYENTEVEEEIHYDLRAMGEPKLIFKFILKDFDYLRKVMICSACLLIFCPK